MANEVQVTTRLTWTKGGASIVAGVSETYDQVGDTAIENIQVIGAASETLQMGDVDDPRFLLFKNENAKPGSGLTQGEKDTYNTENTVHIGIVTPQLANGTVASFSLAPGEGVNVSTLIAAWYAIRAAATDVKLLVAAIQR